MKDRDALCKWYRAEKDCAKGREGTLWHSCVHCQKYEPIRGREPIRKNLKRKKLEDARKRDD